MGNRVLVRQGDRLQIDERPAWTPTKISTEAWYDASDLSTIILGSGSLVTQWDDKSGNNRNVSQSTGSAQPTTGTETLNNLNILDFDNDRLDGNTFANDLYPYGVNTSIFVVGVPDGDTNSIPLMLSEFPDNGLGSVIGLETHPLYDNATFKAFQDEVGTTFSRVVNSTGTLVLGEGSIFGMEFDRSVTNLTTRLRVNGGHEATASNTNREASQANYFSIGGTTSSTTFRTYDGKLCEIIIIHAITTIIRQKVEGYLAWKWGLRGSLPVDHPYKNDRPLA